MSKFIGVKMVEAKPMKASIALSADMKIGNAHSDDMGYEVTYPDGYKSWCPKDVFETAYFPLSSNDVKILNTDVERFINTENIYNIGPKSVIAIIKTITGYECSSVSSCCDSKEYNQEVNDYLARNKAKNAIWIGLEFVLQWAINGIKFTKSNKD